VSKLVVFTGNANPELAQAMVQHLNLPIGNADVGTFSDGEVAVEIQENVRGKDVFIVQSTCNPTNNNIMELLVMADALRRSSAGRITAVMPYFGYARQDRRVRSVLYPSAPDTKIEGKVIRFFDRISSVARNDVVVVNKGLRDGLKEGNVLDVFGQGEVVRDRQRGDRVQLPRERTGSMVIFRVFDKVSYGLIMESTRPIYMNDIAESPAGSY